MVAALTDFISGLLSFSWLTGPIFDKELRVSSRRKRNYILRFAYVALLTMFLVLIWLGEVTYSGSAAWRSTRMSRAGLIITMFVVWFQFLVTQLVAIVMLSTSISDEIYNRTLGVLMTTPINSFQIVMGKLFSKLLQLMLLLAISLPLLAIIRVFGGVPWNYIISSICITLTTIIFVGSVSLFFSIYCRRAYVVIILTILSLGALFLLAPFMTVLMFEDTISERGFLSVLSHINPYAAMGLSTQILGNPRGAGRMFFFWALHCGIMLGLSALLLSLCVKLVRAAGLRQAVGQVRSNSRRRRNQKQPEESSQQQNVNPSIKEVTGSAILWKELKTPIFGRRKIAAIVAIAVGLFALFLTYAKCGEEGVLDEEVVHMVYVTIFMGLAMLFTIILPATSITSEKESRSWPLLLATTQTDWQILYGKLTGAIRRCLPAWIFLFGHIILFCIGTIIHPVAIFQMAVLVTWIIVFLSCSGLYFSSRFKRTTTAVVMNFAFAAVIWLLVPMLMVIISEIGRMGEDFVRGYCNAIPFVQAVVVMTGTAETGWRLGTFEWVEGRFNVWESTLFMLLFMVGYMFLGFLFAWRAKCRFRRNIF